MSQNQRKQAGWKHEIDRIAGGDFEKYMEMTTAGVKYWRRVAIIGWSGWILTVAWFTLHVVTL